MESPLLSIAIITYNRADILRETLKVIVHECQGLDDKIEVLINDNASTDKTKEVVRAFAHPRFSYHQNPSNIGGSLNVLKVLERARGRYVLLHSDDDLLQEGSLSRILDAIARYPDAGVIVSPLLTFDEANPQTISPKPRFPGNGKDVLFSAGCEALSALYLRACCLSGLILRRDRIDLAFAGHHTASDYPQIALTGKALVSSDALFLDFPLMRIRQERVKRWSYQNDFMSGALFQILDSLIQGKDWGKKTRKAIVRKRILSAFAPLFTARQSSLKDFFRVMHNFLKIREYRQSFVFLGMATLFFILGSGNISRLKNLWKGHKGDSVR